MLFLEFGRLEVEDGEISCLWFGLLEVEDGVISCLGFGLWEIEDGVISCLGLNSKPASKSRNLQPKPNLPLNQGISDLSQTCL